MVPNAPVSVETCEGNWEGEWGRVGRPGTKAEEVADPSPLRLGLFLRLFRAVGAHAECRALREVTLPCLRKAGCEANQECSQRLPARLLMQKGSVLEA